MSQQNPPRSEREQTDESLRAERERADRALEDDLAAADETADAVVSRARTRADALLAAARKKTDRGPVREQPYEAMESARAAEDHVLERERGIADDILREERAQHIALLSRERRETDEDLLNERSRSDHALATREDFMGVVSHDLQNMLNAVIGVSALIEREATLGSPVEQVITHARRIQRSGARMQRLVGDLVDVATIEAGVLAVTREVGDPAEVVTEAVETFQAHASGRGVSLVANIVRPVPLAAFDSPRLLQVLSNLLSNAIKFTPAQGTVVVRLEHVAADIHLAVSDTGEGIPPDKLEAVFERFVQRTPNDRRGVGLGLYISKCIVQGHGGRIWVESRLGEGSTFFLTLPVATEG